jgi:hypothetical protein
MPAPVLVVASWGTVTASVLVVFVDVVMGVSRLVVINDALTNRGHLVPLQCRLRINRGLLLLSLRRLLRGKPMARRDRTLGLLHGHSLVETLNLIAGPTGLGGRWLMHIAEKHGSGDDILVGSVEDWGFTRPVLDDVTIDVAGSLSGSSATCTCCALPLEGLLK